MSDLTLNVSEIFYSLQGEGARAGEPSIFVRLQGCSAKYACYRSGVVCDTEFESGKQMTLDDLFCKIIESTLFAGKELDLKGSWIVWTGGEPLDQLTDDILSFFKDKGFRQALETSGIKPFPSVNTPGLLNHITISPKVAEHVLLKNFGRLVIHPELELRYVRHAGQPDIPRPTLKAKYHYLSPHSDGQEINQENLKHCIRLCLENPQWRLSVQMHKIFKIL
jgi:7-carboxy-7-deazaguanine synthase